jgi:hypothetical protein
VITRSERLSIHCPRTTRGLACITWFAALWRIHVNHRYQRRPKSYQPHRPPANSVCPQITRIRAEPNRRIKLGQKDDRQNNRRPYLPSPRSNISVIHFSVNSLPWTPYRLTSQHLRQREHHVRIDRALTNPRNRSSGAIDCASIAIALISIYCRNTLAN